VVYAVWVRTGSAHSYTLDRRFPLATTDAEQYGAYTVPAYRGSGIHTAVVAAMFPVLRDRGVARIIALMKPDNLVALRTPRKLGLRTAGYTGFLELFGIRLYFHHDRGLLRHVRPRYYWRKV
jgi:GNAT superfamily N-acetyltransferase